jgi:hypothetical protein
MDMKLFAVYLGGTAPKANTELHDVVFVAGQRIEDTYEQLMDKWFGDPRGLHLDSWMELDVVDGYRITLRQEKAAGEEKLFFINVGAYRSGKFAEYHDTAFLVAHDAAEAKKRGKAMLAAVWEGPREGSIHTDDLHEVDDCLAITGADGWHVHLELTDAPQQLKPVNGYYIVPKDVVADYVKRKRIA